MPSTLRPPGGGDPYDRVQELLAEGRAHEAVALLREMDHSVDPARNDELLAEASLMLRRHDVAARFARKARAGGRDNPNVRGVLASALWELGDREAARETLGGLDDAGALFTASQWALHERRYADAERFAQLALEREPGYAPAQVNLLFARSAQGDDRAWLRLKSRWTDERRGDAVYPILEEALRRGVSDSVMAIAEDAADETFEDPGYYEAILLFLARAGRIGTALGIAERLPTEIRSSPLVIRTEGLLSAQAGDLNAAVRLLEKAALSEPSDRTIARMLVKALTRTGRWHRLPRVALRYARASFELAEPRAKASERE